MNDLRDAGITCGSKFLFTNKRKREVRECACKCGSLMGVNGELANACIHACNGDPSIARLEGFPNSWVCNNYDGENLFHRYKAILCGINPDSTLLGQSFDDAKQNEKDSTRTRIIIVAVLALVFLILLITYLNRQ